jgi:hypothetical protein
LRWSLGQSRQLKMGNVPPNLGRILPRAFAIRTTAPPRCSPVWFQLHVHVFKHRVEPGSGSN